jgi:hypothetical protein
MNRATIIVITMLLCLTCTAYAEVVVNEVLANEPGGSTSLEWIELYNPSGSVNFAYYELHVISGTQDTVFRPSMTMSAGEYLVLCRDTMRFEEHWGDSSGVWSGTIPPEEYQIYEIPIRLSNDSGRVALYNLTTAPATLVSELVWSTSGEDGYSWERFHYTSTDVAQSVALSGSTPGGMNSISPLPRDLALEDVLPSSDSGLTLLGFRIVNRGLTSVTDGILELYEYDSLAVDSLGDLVAGEVVGEVDSGYAVILVGQYHLSGYYQRLVASLVVPNDDRTSNNRYNFTAPGDAYPPVILSEFLANPDPSTGSEWVELKNVSDSTFNLDSWQLGDSAGLAALTSASTIAPDEYVIIAQDSAAFFLQYPLFVGNCYQPLTWRELNNGSDSVRLFDGFGIQADRFYYFDTHDNNHTWSRAESGEYYGRWGRSEDSGGTPGAVNLVRFVPEGAQSLQITVEPQIISPDGDGRDDSTVIRIQVSEARAYLLKLYDCNGRLVRTIQDEAADLLQEYVWRGENDSGEKLPIGIYVLYFEAVGVESARKTIVVAR